MAQLKRKTRKHRLLSRLGASAKPGIAALLAAGVVAGGVLGVSQTGITGGFEVVTGGSRDAQVELEGEGSQNPEAQLETRAEEVFIVHVDGAVEQPGVYELMGSDLRIHDAVEAAGGLVEGADTSGVNLAAPVVDGSKVHIPLAGELEAQAQSGGASNTGASSLPTLVNINSATADQLCTLSGIGEATAANIIADREQNGPFTCIEDLMRVSGIGERKFERVKDHICV